MLVSKTSFSKCMFRNDLTLTATPVRPPPSPQYNQMSQQGGTFGWTERGGGGRTRGSVNVRSFPNRHLENEVFETSTFPFHIRSCFSVFVVVIVVLLLLFFRNRTPSKRKVFHFLWFIKGGVSLLGLERTGFQVTADFVLI